MKLAVKNVITGEILGTVLTNHRMSLDEVIELLDIKCNKTDEDYQAERYSFYEDLELVQLD